MKTATQNIEIIQLFDVECELTKEETPLGLMYIMKFICSEDRINYIITEAVKKGLPHERFNGGVNICYFA